MSKYFQRVSTRVAEDVEPPGENDADADAHPALYPQLVIAMKTAGFSPDNASSVSDFVKVLRRVTAAKITRAHKKLTTSKAVAAGKAAKAASRE